MQIRTRIYALVTILCSLVIAALFCEIMARILAPSWLTQRMAMINKDQSIDNFGTDRGYPYAYHNGKIFGFKPLSQFDVTHVEFQYTANINEFGARKVSFSPGIDLQFLPMLGDSLTFGIGVADDETFSSKLAQEISGMRVLNLGIPGSALHDHIPIIKSRHSEFKKPETYIFFFFLENDFANMIAYSKRGSGFTSSPIEDNNLATEVHKVSSYINDIVYHNSILQRLFSIQLVRQALIDGLNAWRRTRGLQPQFVEEVFFLMDKRLRSYQAEAIKNAEVHLARLKALQKELSFSTLIVSIPSIYQLDDVRLRRAANRFRIPFNVLDPLRPNRMLRGLVEKQGFAFVDTTECLGKMGSARELYYREDIHFTAEGHSELAHCVGPHIRQFLASGARRAKKRAHIRN